MSTGTATGSAQTQRHIRYRAGDFVLRRDATPVLCEVIAVEEEGLLRVRGVGWPLGFSVLVDAAELSPMRSLLDKK